MEIKLLFSTVPIPGVIQDWGIPTICLAGRMFREAGMWRYLFFRITNKGRNTDGIFHVNRGHLYFWQESIQARNFFTFSFPVFRNET